MLQPGKFWRDVCEHIERPDLIDDLRFADNASIMENTVAAVEILWEVIGSRTLAEWTKRFATLSGPWAPVQDSLQVGADDQVRANDYIIDVGDIELVSSPVQFDVTKNESTAAPGLPSTPMRSWRSWASTGTASSNSKVAGADVAASRWLRPGVERSPDPS